MCVLYYIIVVHNSALNSSDNLPFQTIITAQMMSVVEEGQYT